MNEEEFETDVGPDTDMLIYKVGAKVVIKENSEQGIITGTSRGRIGVEVEGNSIVSYFPTQIELISEEVKPSSNEVVVVDDVSSEGEHILPANYFTQGLSVIVNSTQETGTVTGNSRGRVGVKLSYNTSPVSFFPQQLTPKGNSDPISFKSGDKVTIKSSNQVGVVTSAIRGKVGVDIDGDIQSFFPNEITSTDQEEVNFNTGDKVTIISSEKTGVVTGTSRGRVGVEVDDKISSYFPNQIKKLVDEEEEEEEVAIESVKYSAGDKVIILSTEQTGVVTGTSRGRVGVEVDDKISSYFPNQIKKLGDEETESVKYSAGDKVIILSSEQTGVVTGTSRGRVGVEVDDKISSYFPNQIKKLGDEEDEDATESVKYSAGDKVVILSTEQAGVVTGTSRGRVGVEIDDKISSYFPNQIKKLGDEEDEDATESVKYSAGDKVVILSTEQAGVVTGTSRGRVGVEIDDKISSYFPNQIKKLDDEEEEDATEPVKYSAGDKVVILSTEQAGVVTGTSRGRVGVEVDDKISSYFPNQIKKLVDEEEDEDATESVKYSAGDKVVIISTEKTGVVTGTSRGRVGVEVDDKISSYFPNQIKKLGDEEDEDATESVKYSAGDKVVILSTEQAGVVTGTSRGRVGVEVDDKISSYFPNQIKKLGDEEEEEEEDATESVKYSAGDKVVILSTEKTGVVTGTSRGRVGDKISSYFPNQIKKLDEEEEEDVTEPVKYSAGDKVVILSTEQAGVVTGTSRGRVGVEVDDKISSYFPNQIKKLGDEEEEDVTESVKYSAGDKVVILSTEQAGVVTGTSRGRVGVEVDDKISSYFPNQIKKLVDEEEDEDVPESVKYSAGDKVIILSTEQTGVVTGTSRGRVGVEVDDKISSYFPNQIKKLGDEEDEDVTEPVKYSAGDKVVILSTEQAGVVTGTSRGRVGVEVDDKISSYFPNQIKKLGDEEDTEIPSSDELKKYSVGDKVVIISTEKTGTVTGKSRGRVGVEVDDEIKSYFPNQIAKKELSFEDRPQSPTANFRIGDQVKVKSSGTRGIVSEITDSQVGISVNGSTVEWTSPDDLIKFNRRSSKAVLMALEDEEEVTFEVGDVVKVLATGQQGCITNINEEKISVLLDDDTDDLFISKDLEQVILSPYADPSSNFIPGLAVEVISSGKRGKVTGTSRGRIGVKIDDTIQSFFPEHIKLSDPSEVDDAENNTIEEPVKKHDETKSETSNKDSFDHYSEGDADEEEHKYECGDKIIIISTEAKGSINEVLNDDCYYVESDQMLEKYTASELCPAPLFSVSDRVVVTATQAKGRISEVLFPKKQSYNVNLDSSGIQEFTQKQLLEITASDSDSEPDETFFEVGNAVLLKQIDFPFLKRATVKEVYAKKRTYLVVVDDESVEKPQSDLQVDPSSELEKSNPPTLKFSIGDLVRKKGNETTVAIVEYSIYSKRYTLNGLGTAPEEDLTAASPSPSPKSTAAAKYSVDDRVLVKSGNKQAVVVEIEKSDSGYKYEVEEKSGVFNTYSEDELDVFTEKLTPKFAIDSRVIIIATNSDVVVTEIYETDSGYKYDIVDKAGDIIKFSEDDLEFSTASEPQFAVDSQVVIKSTDKRAVVVEVHMSDKGIEYEVEEKDGNFSRFQEAELESAPPPSQPDSESDYSEAEPASASGKPPAKDTGDYHSDGDSLSSVSTPCRDVDKFKKGDEVQVSTDVGRRGTVIEIYETSCLVEINGKEETHDASLLTHYMSEGGVTDLDKMTRQASPRGNRTSDDEGQENDAAENRPSSSASRASSTRSSIRSKVQQIKDSRRESAASSISNSPSRQSSTKQPRGNTGGPAGRKRNQNTHRSASAGDTNGTANGTARRSAWSREKGQEIDKTKLISQLKAKNSDLHEAVETVRVQLEQLLQKRKPSVAGPARRKRPIRSKSEDKTKLEDELRLLTYANEALAKKYREASREEKLEVKLAEMTAELIDIRENNKSMLQKQRDNEKKLKKFNDPEKIRRDTLRGFKDELTVLRITKERMDKQRQQSLGHSDFQQKRITQLQGEDKYPDITAHDIRKSAELHQRLAEVSEEKENLEYHLNVLAKQTAAAKKIAEVQKIAEEREDIQELKKELKTLRKALGIDQRTPVPSPKKRDAQKEFVKPVAPPVVVAGDNSTETDSRYASRVPSPTSESEDASPTPADPAIEEEAPLSEEVVEEEKPIEEAKESPQKLPSPQPQPVDTNSIAEDIPEEEETKPSPAVNAQTSPPKEMILAEDGLPELKPLVVHDPNEKPAYQPKVLLFTFLNLLFVVMMRETKTNLKHSLPSLPHLQKLRITKMTTRLKHLNQSPQLTQLMNQRKKTTSRHGCVKRNRGQRNRGLRKKNYQRKDQQRTGLKKDLMKNRITHLHQLMELQQTIRTVSQMDMKMPTVMETPLRSRRRRNRFGCRTTILKNQNQNLLLNVSLLQSLPG